MALENSIFSSYRHSFVSIMVFPIGFLLASALFVTSTFAAPPVPSTELARRNTTNGPLPGWSFVGCYTDRKSSSRTLLSANFVDDNMTPAMCLSFCQGNVNGTDSDDAPLTGFNFAGMEYSKECYCDYNIQGTAKKVDDVVCSFPCGGDPSFTCGAAGLVSVYQNTALNDPLPKNKPTLGDWKYIGCHTDAVNGHGRTLARRVDIPGTSGVTIESCTTQCSDEGFGLSGLEFGQECWCGSSFLVANTTTSPGDCSQACKADHTELCGAANRLSVYKMYGYGSDQDSA